MGKYEDFFNWWDKLELDQEKKRELSERYLSKYKTIKDIKAKIEDKSKPLEAEELEKLKEDLKALEEETKDPKELILKWINEENERKEEAI